MATFLPTTGPLSMSDINGLFARGNNLNAYRGTTYYTASGGPFTFPSTSSPISFNNFRGTGPTSNAVPDLSLLSATYLADYYGLFPNDGELQMYSDGTWTWFDQTGAAFSGNWLSSGVGAGAGNGFWLRTNVTSIVGTNGSTTSTANGAWVNMGTTQIIQIRKNTGGSSAYSAYYTFQISSSSSGSPVVSSRSNILFTASGV